MSESSLQSFVLSGAPPSFPASYGSDRELINSAAREIWVQMMCELTHHKIFSIQTRGDYGEQKKYPQPVFD